MKNFKNYLQTQLNIIEIKLKGILTEIENIPDPQYIDITAYGSKEQIRKEYIKNEKVTLFKRIIGPSTTELQSYIRKRELNRLSKLKSTYERQISQIKQALPVITEQGITGEIWPNEVIIREMLTYAKTHNINPESLLKFIIQLCVHSKENDKVEDKIKKNITNFFDESGNLLSGAKLSTVYLLLDKLFQSAFKEKELEEYEIVISQLYVQLRIEKDKLEKKETKPELELQRRALKELQDYINGTTIIRTLDIDNFKLLLKTAGIDISTQNELISQMELKIEEENRIIRMEKTLEAMKRFLTEDELELVKKADLKEKTISGPLKDLLSRAKKDVISMCKYLSYFDQIDDIHEALAILNDRTRVLKNVLINIDENDKEPNSLFYVTDKEGVPVFLRNLELQSIETYGNIYNLLYKIAIKGKGKRLFHKDNIDFYYIGCSGIKVVYTELNGTRIIVGIDSIKPSYSVKQNMTKEMIDKIHDIEHKSFNPTFKEIHATYENVILEALNVKETGYSLTLKKKDE